MGSLARVTRFASFTCLVVLAALPPGLAQAAEEAAQHAEPGIVNLNITTLIQVVNFLILIALLMFGGPVLSTWMAPAIWLNRLAVDLVAPHIILSPWTT